MGSGTAQQERDAEVAEVKHLVAAAALCSPDDDGVRVRAIAEALLGLARDRTTRRERHDERRFERLVADAPGRHFTVAFADRFLRPVEARTAIRSVSLLLQKYGLPGHVGRWQRFLLNMLGSAGAVFPGVARKRATRVLAREIGWVAWPAAPDKLRKMIEKSKRGGFRVILNALGEQVLGTQDATARLEKYTRLLADPAVDAVSVKLSSIVARLDAFATDAVMPHLGERVAALLNAARRPVGSALVMFDMEEYRDVGLTAGLVKLIAHETSSAQRLGVVVQAYLPDSAALLADLVAVSAARVAAGGLPLRIRLVKGANLAMERVEASLRGWAQAPFRTKAEVDANYRRLMRVGVDAAARGDIELGLATHNLFDMALGLLWRARARAEARVGFEMLVGIGRPLARVMAAVSGDVMLYAPVVAQDDLLSAIAYLIRRFDENTSADNYLRHSFGMVATSRVFEAEHRKLVESLSAPPPVVRAPQGWDSIRAGANRLQDRRFPEPVTETTHFANAPDTDWTAGHARTWIQTELKTFFEAPAPSLRPCVNGVFVDGEPIAGIDPSRPGLVLHEAMLASRETMEQAVDVAFAKVGRGTWLGPTAMRARADVLVEAARLVRERRGRLIAAMVTETAKIVPEADVEVSEAVDFLVYYAECAREIAGRDQLRTTPLGVMVVASPWNFPLAIAVGGIAAALAAGNAVIFKPAPEAILVGSLIADIFRDAGVPPGALQFLPCSNEPVGRELVCHPNIAGVILTGGTATANRFLTWRPRLRLFAETGGKNAAIITDTADRDLAIKHIVHGAFSHAGQKCSATSLLVCVDAVTRDPRFLERLKDAVETLVSGPASSPRTDVPPLIRPPRDALESALSTLEPGERWLVEPRRDPRNPRLVTPGVKIGVKPGSPTHRTELFGPVLAVMSAPDLPAAIAIANATPYGLTAGLHSLDEGEQAFWTNHIKAGNLYINRATTGAIVGRQPFGGLKASSFGPGAKAGGPNYVMQFLHPSPRQPTLSSGLVPVPVEAPSIAPVVPDYRADFEAHYARPTELAGLLGQDNVFRYLPVRAVLVRLGRGATAWDAERMLTATRVVGCTVHVSAAEAAVWHAALGVPVRVEVPEVLAETLGNLDPEPERVRVSGAIADVLLVACLARGWHVDDTPVVSDGRVELLKYLREQVISTDWHRYGNLGDREGPR